MSSFRTLIQPLQPHFFSMPHIAIVILHLSYGKFHHTLAQAYVTLRMPD
jgi:hypothetical protein